MSTHWPDERVVVTGGAGFLGSFLLEELNRRGAKEVFVPQEKDYDLVICNPPYVAEGSPDLEQSVAEWEPVEALLAGADGLDAIRQIIQGAPDHLKAGGWLVLEIGADQGAAVRELLTKSFDNTEIRKDIAGHDRIALAQSVHP